jgi:hypothetical protein
VLQPNKEGTVEILLDATRFLGPKTRSHYLTIWNGKTTETWVLIITADSQDPPQP